MISRELGYTLLRNAVSSAVSGMNEIKLFVSYHGGDYRRTHAVEALNRA